MSEHKEGWSVGFTIEVRDIAGRTVNTTPSVSYGYDRHSANNYAAGLAQAAFAYLTSLNDQVETPGKPDKPGRP